MQTYIIFSGIALAAALLGASPSHGLTIYVANNGRESTFCGLQVINGFTCGAKETPCRSIQCAIREADPGDTIIVGPGRYGDLNKDGDQTDEGEEFGSSGCSCLLSVNKAVTIVSSHGAASTVIDAHSMDVARNVLLLLNGGEFGRPGKGFTVTNTKRHQADGIEVDGANVKLRGNQIVSSQVAPFSGEEPLPRNGIVASSGGPVLIQANQVIGQWSQGIVARGTGKTVRNNQVSASEGIGIFGADDALLLGNIVSAVGAGVWVRGGASAITNAVYGNHYGIVVEHDDEVLPFTGTVERNNIVGNFCGFNNLNLGAPVPLEAQNNYWGAASGPGADPADTACADDEGPTNMTPFATAPFRVNAPIKP